MNRKVQRNSVRRTIKHEDTCLIDPLAKNRCEQSGRNICCSAADDNSDGYLPRFSKQQVILQLQNGWPSSHLATVIVSNKMGAFVNTDNSCNIDTKWCKMVPTNFYSLKTREVICIQHAAVFHE